MDEFKKFAIEKGIDICISNDVCLMLDKYLFIYKREPQIVLANYFEKDDREQSLL